MTLRRRGTNLPKMGDFNQSVILEAIRRSGEGLSRTELVETTGLSAQTVTNITRRLIADGLIDEAGRTISGPGKPRTTLRLNAGSRLSIGVHLDPTTMTFVLLDLAGSVIADDARRTPPGTADQLITAMADGVADLIRGAGITTDDVAGIGVAAPGPLDAERGTVIDPPKLHSWHRVPLRDALAAATGIDVTLEKDTTAAAVAELWRGDDPSSGSFLFVYLGSGIGTALVIDGDVVRGASRNVGEVGHIIVDPDGPACACGRRGCVDVVCTPAAIVQRAEHAGLFGATPEADAPAVVDARFTQLCAQADAGEQPALRILEEAIGHFSVLVSSLTNMLDVDRVVLGGPFWSRAERTALRVLPVLLEAQSATRAVRGLPVSGTVVGEEVGAIGAGCLVLDEILTPRASALLLDS
ncbi:ROK family transcriptional regulator [uncultured Microbacterium sp.]|uniref:ROK family transcriptional regulator n=1 Tax=uncultured Microbacterium sp. TaxID=191216 RepID=UPI0034599D41